MDQGWEVLFGKKDAIFSYFLSVGLGLLVVGFFFNIKRIQVKKNCMYKGGED